MGAPRRRTRRCTSSARLTIPPSRQEPACSRAAPTPGVATAGSDAEAGRRPAEPAVRDDGDLVALSGACSADALLHLGGDAPLSCRRSHVGDPLDGHFPISPPVSTSLVSKENRDPVGRGDARRRRRSDPPPRRTAGHGDGRRRRRSTGSDPSTGHEITEVEWASGRRAAVSPDGLVEATPTMAARTDEQPTPPGAGQRRARRPRRDPARRRARRDHPKARSLSPSPRGPSLRLSSGSHWQVDRRPGRGEHVAAFDPTGPALVPSSPPPRSSRSVSRPSTGRTVAGPARPHLQRRAARCRRGGRRRVDVWPALRPKLAPESTTTGHRRPPATSSARRTALATGPDATWARRRSRCWCVAGTPAELGTPRARCTAAEPDACPRGTDPESIEQVRQRAPGRSVSSLRAVTADDYARRAEQAGTPGPALVQRAVARSRRTGSWYRVVVCRRPGRGRRSVPASSMPLPGVLSTTTGWQATTSRSCRRSTCLSRSGSTSPSTRCSDATCVAEALTDLMSDRRLPGRDARVVPSRPVSRSARTSTSGTDRRSRPGDPRRGLVVPTMSSRYRSRPRTPEPAGIESRRPRSRGWDNDPSRPECAGLLPHRQIWRVDDDADLLVRHLDVRICRVERIADPVGRDRRPGLPAIRRRVATHGTGDRVDDAARLSRPDLPGLHASEDARRRPGPSRAVALVDAGCRRSGHRVVLHRPLANESYLRTATERRSLVEVLALGSATRSSRGPPRPSTSRSPSRARRGRHRSPRCRRNGGAEHAGPGPAAGRVETLADLVASPAWNTLRPQPRVTVALPTAGATTPRRSPSPASSPRSPPATACCSGQLCAARVRAVTDALVVDAAPDQPGKPGSPPARTVLRYRAWPTGSRRRRSRCRPGRSMRRCRRRTAGRSTIDADDLASELAARSSSIEPMIEAFATSDATPGEVILFSGRGPLFGSQAPLASSMIAVAVAEAKARGAAVDSAVVSWLSSQALGAAVGLGYRREPSLGRLRRRLPRRRRAPRCRFGAGSPRRDRLGRVPRHGGRRTGARRAVHQRPGDRRPRRRHPGAHLFTIRKTTAFTGPKRYALADVPGADDATRGRSRSTGCTLASCSGRRVVVSGLTSADVGETGDARRQRSRGQPRPRQPADDDHAPTTTSGDAEPAVCASPRQRRAGQRGRDPHARSSEAATHASRSSSSPCASRR